VSVSFVNGYTCFSSCDAATARSGKDPHPKTPGLGDDSKQNSSIGGKRDDSVIFGGAPAGLNSDQPRGVTAPSASDPTTPGSRVDLLA